MVLCVLASRFRLTIGAEKVEGLQDIIDRQTNALTVLLAGLQKVCF